MDSAIHLLNNWGLADKLGLEDFAIALVNSVRNMPDRRLFLGEFKFYRGVVINNPVHQNFGGASYNDSWACTC